MYNVHFIQHLGHKNYIFQSDLRELNRFCIAKKNKKLAF